MKKTHIVVGAGSGGITLAKKLLERDDVVLIDHGVVLTENQQVYSNWFENLLNIHPQLVLWCYRSFVSPLAKRVCTISQPGMLDRVIQYSQGFGNGGSGGVNAMIYTLGSKTVYDTMWPISWSSNKIASHLCNVLTYYSPRRMETSGHVLSILSAGGEKALATVMDDKGFVPSYFASINETGVDRINQAAVALGGGEERAQGSLTVLQNTVVKRVEFSGNVAVGVIIEQYFYNEEKVSKMVEPSNGGEIILCAGAFETPRVLISSGLLGRAPGCCEEATVSNLPVLPDIGENLQDHVVLPYMLLGNWFRNWSVFHRDTVPGYAGKPAFPLNGIHGWVNLCEDGTVWSDKSSAPPSVQLLFIDGRVSASILPMMIPRYSGAGVYASLVYPLLYHLLKWVSQFALIRWLCGYFFGILVCLTQPKSRGRLSVDPDNPVGPLLRDPNYLSDARDLDMLRKGMHTARALVQHERKKAGGSLFLLEVFPGPLFAYGRSEKWFEFYARMMSSTYFHACGTCAMSVNEKDVREEIHQRHNPSVSVRTTSKQQKKKQKKQKKQEEEEEEEKGKSNDATDGAGVVNGMGTGTRRGVLDDELRVHGVKKLRVADASAIPAIPSGPTQAICMILGEACGQFILSTSNSNMCTNAK